MLDNPEIDENNPHARFLNSPLLEKMMTWDFFGVISCFFLLYIVFLIILGMINPKLVGK